MSARAELSNTSGPVRFLVHYLEISSVRVPSNCQVWSTYHLIIFNLLSGSPPATSHHQVTWLDIHLSGASPVSLREKFPCVLYLLSWLYHLPFIVRKRNYPSACLPASVVQMFKITQWIYYGREKLRYFQILVIPFRNVRPMIFSPPRPCYVYFWFEKFFIIFKTKRHKSWDCG